jgi:hypothetical protein
MKVTSFTSPAIRKPSPARLDPEHPLHASFRTTDRTHFPTVSMTMLKPAMEHTQPLWGPPDPYLSAGKSLAPKLSDVAATNTETWSEEARTLLKHGVQILDGSSLHAERVLPGFTPTGSLLSPHSVSSYDASTPAVWAATVEWAADFANVIDKLPIAALVYVLVEFFLLRPNLDLYKEDVEVDPTRALTDAVAVTGVRVAMFCVVAVVTVGVFGG